MCLYQFWNLYGILFTVSTRPALFGGGLIGYVIYDMIHYYVHHGHPTKQSIKKLKVRDFSHLIFFLYVQRYFLI